MTTKTDADGIRHKYAIIGAAGFENPFNTSKEVVNFCLAVFKRKIDPDALKDGALEFLDDGGVSRSEKAKLKVAHDRLQAAIKSIMSARAVFMKGDLSEGSTNMKMIEAMEGLESPIMKMCGTIKDTVTPPVVDKTVGSEKESANNVKVDGDDANNSDDEPIV